MSHADNAMHVVTMSLAYLQDAVNDEVALLPTGDQYPAHTIMNTLVLAAEQAARSIGARGKRRDELFSSSRQWFDLGKRQMRKAKE